MKNLQNHLRSWWKNFLAICFGFVVAFILVEIILRVFQPFPFRVQGYRITLPVHQHFEIKNNHIPKLDKVVVHSKNSLGFRGDEPPADWKNHQTLLTVGGSTTECSFLSNNKTWQEQLKIRIQPTFPNFWINNAGFDGHSTFGHQVLLEDYIVPLRPTFVCFLTGINDVATADFEEFDRQILKEINTSSFKLFFKSLANYSETIGLAYNFYRYQLAAQQGLIHQNVDFATLPTVNVTQEKRENSLQFHRKEFLKNYENRLVKLVKTCQDNGITPILMTQPLAVGYGIDPQTGQDLAKIAYEFDNLNGEVAWQRLELYNEVVRQVARKRGVRLIDLAQKLEKNTLYFYDFVHYTNEGTARIGEILAQEFQTILTHPATR